MLCAICLSRVDASRGQSNPITTWCLHHFHGFCLEHALRYRAHCPVCRALLLPTITPQPQQPIPYFRQFGVVASRW